MPRFANLLDPDSYSASQAFSTALRSKGSAGIVYPSVRAAGEECVAAFRPRVVTRLPTGDEYLLYHYEDRRVDRIFDWTAATWFDPPYRSIGE